MDDERLRACLDVDYLRLREVARAADLTSPVPTCPGWTLADLVQHVGAVYLHKVECMRLGSHPDPWPPEGLNEEPPLELIDRSYAALAAEFAARRPADHAFTWYDPDQSVGFWIRRMAQETVIHRVDAELAAGVPLAPIPGDLAADGIDELFVAFIEYGTTVWPDEYADTLADAGERTVRVSTPERAWTLRLTTKDVRVVESDVDSPDATIEGRAADVLLWLWSRGGEAGTSIIGDADTVALMRQVLVVSTQ
jgi:uncharacterized protein (TIGR03083 family)